MKKAEDKEMKAIDAIKGRLRELYLSGKTDAQLAKMADCSTTHMNNLRNGKRDISGVSVDFLLKLFPDLDAPIVAVCQGQSQVTQIANGNNGSASATNIASPSAVAIAGDGDRLKDCRQAAIDEIINLDIPDDIRTKVLRVLSKTLQ